MYFLQSPIARFLLHRVTRNVVFWLLFAGVPVYVNWDGYGSPANFYTDLLFYAELAVMGYLNNLVLIPRLIDRGRPGAYFLAAGLLVATTTALGLFVLTPLVSDYLSRVTNYFVRYWFNLGDYLFFLGAFTGAALLSRLATAKRRRAEAEALQAETELAFLRAQVNPHLLFNTLNMLYGSAVEKSSKVPDMMLHLSESLRYSVRVAQLERVPLSDEVLYLRDYVALQQMRLEERGLISFRDQTEWTGIDVAPLLLIVPVENAFKYATANLTGRLRIDIDLYLAPGLLFLTVTNDTDPDRGGPTPPGTGLDNLRRRLELIYGDAAELTFTEAGNRFVVRLKIPVKTPAGYGGARVIGLNNRSAKHPPATTAPSEPH